MSQFPLGRSVSVPVYSQPEESLGSRMIRDLFVRIGESSRVPPRGTEIGWSDAAEGALIKVLRGERLVNIHEHDAHEAVTALWNKRAEWMGRLGY